MLQTTSPSRYLVRALAFNAVLSFSIAQEEEECPAGAAAAGCGSPFKRIRAHLWPHARGHPPKYSVTNLTAPDDISKPWYSWFPGATRFRSTVLCGPLIDFEKNLYVTSVDGIHKLTTDGTRIWEFLRRFADCPSLKNDVLFGADVNGVAFALDIHSGKPLWEVKHNQGSGDTGYIEVSDEGVVVYEADPDTARVMAVDAMDGSKLWDFRPDAQVWNLMAMFPGDDTVLFQDADAKVYRLGLRNGSLLWASGGNHMPFKTWSDGGLMLGPNGIVYAVSSKGTVMTHHPTVGGGVHAYRVSDGSLVWERPLLRPFFTWPVVGKLAGYDGLSVIVAIGSNAYFPWQEVFGMLLAQTENLFVILPIAWQLCRCCRGGFKSLVFRCVVSFSLVLLLVSGLTFAYTRGWTFVPVDTYDAEVFAFDAETGVQQWVYKLPTWPYVSAAGDGVGWNERRIHSPHRKACLPASYSSPTIDGTGTVWIGYMSGMVLGLKDSNRDGIVAGDEVTEYDTKAAFLHSGPAFAPGLFAITNCDSLHVWKV